MDLVVNTFLALFEPRMFLSLCAGILAGIVGGAIPGITITMTIILTLPVHLRDAVPAGPGDHDRGLRRRVGGRADFRVPPGDSRNALGHRDDL